MDVQRPTIVSPSRRLAWWSMVLVLVVLVVQVLAFHRLRHDDAYITYRYGQNLAQGHGLVFNPGERILGTTAPGHALLAGGLYNLVGKERLPTVMATLGCVGWMAQALAVYALLMPFAGRRTALFVAACLAAGATDAPRWIALETTLVLAFALWAIVLALRHRWIAAAALAAVAGLIRPDAHWLTVLLGAMAIGQLRRDVGRPALAWGLVSVPWLCFAFLYYGSPMPHTATAKAHATSALAYGHHLLTLPARIVLDSASTLAVVAFWLLAVMGSGFLARRDRQLLVLPAYALGHSLAYGYLRPDPGHAWHLNPSVTVWAILALVGAAWLLSRFARLPKTFVAVALAAWVAGYGWRTAEFARSYGDQHWFGARDHAYHQAAGYLNTHSARGDLVTSFEVGTVGYLTERAIYDWSGLVTKSPVFPSHRPNERWYVVDDGSLHVMTEAGYRRAATFRHGSFNAYVFEKTRSERATP